MELLKIQLDNKQKFDYYDFFIFRLFIFGEGGPEFSPFHYLGPVWGPRLYDRLIGKPRIHQPFETLYPTYIGQTLDWIRQEPHLECLHCVPRYYPEFAWITQCPLIREFLAWNTALLIRKRA